MMRILFPLLFFGLIGIAGLVEIIYFLVTGNESILINGSNSYFIKYSMVIGLMDIGLTMLLIPIFGIKGIITLDYYNADHYEQAKTTFVLGSLFMPGFIFMSIAGFIYMPGKTLVMDGLLFLIYLSSIINLVCRKRGG